MASRIRKAVLPVAGLGTRFLPATKTIPKEMLPVVDKPLVQYAVEEALSAGIDEVIFVTGRNKSVLEDYFDLHYELENTLRERGRDAEYGAVSGVVPDPGCIAYTRQQHPLGLGHAIWCARHLVGDERFAILLPDDLVLADVPCLQQMIDAAEATGGNVVAVEDVPRELTSSYGVLDAGADDGRLVEVRGLVEKPAPAEAPSTLSVIGRYVLSPGIFDLLGEMRPGAGNEIQLTDALARMIGQAPFHGLRFSGRRFDCGDKTGLLEANIAYALEREDTMQATRDLLQAYLSPQPGDARCA